eukprot:12912802-Prorocentrum_lima.AAC.1
MAHLQNIAREVQEQPDPARTGKSRAKSRNEDARGDIDGQSSEFRDAQVAMQLAFGNTPVPCRTRPPSSSNLTGTDTDTPGG